MKHSKNSLTKGLSYPPCHFQAGRLDVSWISVYDIRQLELVSKIGSDSLPLKYTAYKINTQALYSYLKEVNNLPYDHQIINMPVNGGDNCIEFHLQPSGVMSSALQEKYPNIKSWKGISVQNPNVELRLDFDGESIRAIITQGDKVEAFSPWPDKSGSVYYLLYNEKDAGFKRIPFQSY